MESKQASRVFVCATPPRVSQPLASDFDTVEVPESPMESKQSSRIFVCATPPRISQPLANDTFEVPESPINDKANDCSSVEEKVLLI